MLTPEYKLNRVDIFRTLLTCFQAKPKYFYRRLVTQKETFIRYFTPESKKSVEKLWFSTCGRLQADRAYWQGDGFCIPGFWRRNHDRRSGKKVTTINKQYYASEVRQLK